MTFEVLCLIEKRINQTLGIKIYITIICFLSSAEAKEENGKKAGLSHENQREINKVEERDWGKEEGEGEGGKYWE